MSAVTQNILLRRRHRQEELQDRAAFLATAKGDKGDTGPMPAHEWKGTALRFEQPNGTWGKFVDLKGATGKDGNAGRTVVISRGGSSGGGVGSLLPGAPNVEPTGIAVVQGGQWVNLAWPTFIQAIAGAVDVGVEMARRTDFVGESMMYRGEAAPGSLESAPVWRVKRIEFLTGADGKQDIDEKWAGGNSNFDKTWVDRASLEYV
jgi:hypothetical protein